MGQIRKQMDKTQPLSVEKRQRAIPTNEFASRKKRAKHARMRKKQKPKPKSKPKKPETTVEIVNEVVESTVVTPKGNPVTEGTVHAFSLFCSM